MTDDNAAAIRHAEPSDELSVRACVEDAYSMYLDRMDRPPAPMLDDYAALIDREVLYVATLDGTVVGLIVLWLESDHLYVDNIAVTPSAQGHGVAMSLLAFAEHEARRHGRAEIRLYTNEAMTENLGYYQKRQFVETHRANVSGYDRVYFTRHLVQTEI